MDPERKATTKKDVFDRMNRIDRIRIGPAAIVLLFPNSVHPVNFSPKMNGTGRWQTGIDGNEQTTSPLVLALHALLCGKNLLGIA